MGSPGGRSWRSWGSLRGRAQKPAEFLAAEYPTATWRPWQAKLAARRAQRSTLGSPGGWCLCERRKQGADIKRRQRRWWTLSAAVDALTADRLSSPIFRASIPDRGAATEARVATRPAQRKAVEKRARKAAEKRARKAEAAARAPLREAVARLEARPPSHRRRARSTERGQATEHERTEKGRR
ncbi:hypothetical protein T492DRAFT_834900 [Pavlovales sp. CCMP2436]|nr:hypothetical protein T492DRAFT_834900 [Pavlovales sp. CCMP2436]